ncbi:MAG: MarR family transcriptional regulator [Filomicrobium sp.]
MSEKKTRPTRSKPPLKKEPSAWPMFLKAHDALVARVEERLCDAGLPDLSWFTVLWVLERAPDQRLRMAELADAAVIPRSNLTRLVDKLEKDGLVVRERVSGDRRGAYARLTPEGDSMRKAMWTVYKPAINEVFLQHLSAQETVALREMMERLLEANHTEV